MMSDWRDGPSVTYAQGHWVAVVGPNEWLLVNADPDDDSLREDLRQTLADNKCAVDISSLPRPTK